MRSATIAEVLPSRHDWRSVELGRRHRVQLTAGALDVYERGAGPAMLFAHGWLANANLWRHLVPTLARHFRCIIPDLPLGAHLHPMADDFDGSPEGIAGLIHGVLDALDVDQTILVGNDSGGAYSQVAAALRPDRIRALVLNACESPYDSFPPEAFRGLQEAARSPGTLADLLSALRDPAVRFSPAAFGGLIKYGIPDEVSDSYALPCLELPGVCADACRVMPAASQESVARAAERLVREFRRPVLFVWPSEDVFSRCRTFVASRPSSATDGSRSSRTRSRSRRRISRRGWRRSSCVRSRAARRSVSSQRDPALHGVAAEGRGAGTARAARGTRCSDCQPGRNGMTVVFGRIGGERAGRGPGPGRSRRR